MSDEFRDVFQNEVIRASAGTGKTFQLSNRFLRLLASGVECETILATTFTRKGAGEILDRIVQRLAQAATSQAGSEKLATELEWALTQERAQELLKSLIQNLHRLQISTLDAFFYRVAQSFRLELGLPTEWEIADQQQIDRLQHQVIHEILRDKTVIDLVHLMTKGEAQRRIADLIRATVNELYPIALESEASAWDRLPHVKKLGDGEDFEPLIEQLLTIEYPHSRQRSKIESEIELVRSSQWLDLAKSSVFASVASGKNN